MNWRTHAVAAMNSAMIGVGTASGAELALGRTIPFLLLLALAMGIDYVSTVLWAEAYRVEMRP